MADPAAQRDATHAEAPARPFSANAIHVLRTVQNNTLTLSRMADQKASILMGATFLVFSISLSRSLTGELPWSLYVLAAFSFLSSLCAVMAVLPSLSRTLPPGSKRNRMFFGHFHDLEEEAWTRDVLGELHADETVFRLMLHDIYQNGQVLHHRKYRYLGWAYRLFILGLIASVVAFAVELALRAGF